MTKTFLAVMIGAVMSVAQAQTTPAPAFQNATLTGSGNTITATRIPVVLSSTVTIYVDMTLQFNSDSNGNLTLASGFPQFAQSPAVVTGGFHCGDVFWDRPTCSMVRGCLP